MYTLQRSISFFLLDVTNQEAGHQVVSYQTADTYDTGTRFSIEGA